MQNVVLSFFPTLSIAFVKCFSDSLCLRKALCANTSGFLTRIIKKRGRVGVATLLRQGRRNYFIMAVPFYITQV
jgi:hypothetical protein